jgi:GTP-binding protein HflX
VLHLDLDPADGATLAWLYRHGHVIERRDDEGGHVHLTVGLDPAAKARFDARQRSAAE